MTPKEFDRMQLLNMLKSLCFDDSCLYNWTFEKDNGKNPVMKVARDYVSKWSDFASKNAGLVLWGDVGTGKTFFAACIANALVEQNVSVKMTNFSTILNDLFAESDKNKYLDRQGSKLTDAERVSYIDNRLIGSATPDKSVTLASGISVSASFENLGDVSKTSYYKLFLWNSISGLIPLDSVKVFNQKMKRGLHNCASPVFVALFICLK